MTWSRKMTAYLKDMELCPESNDTLYCVDENKCYRSVDFGDTWDVVLTTVSHRMALSVTANNPDFIAIITTLDSKPFKLYKSTNRGENWSFNNLNGFSEGEGQGGYNLDIVIDPLNENIMYGGMINIYKSTDGGMNWVNQEPVYADDQHVFEFHPVTHRLFIGNDSGIWYTDNGTLYSYSSNGLRITTSYRMDVAAQNPQRIIIGNQDASTFVTDGVFWYRSLGGDGMTCKFDPTDQNYVYGSSQSGPVSRSTNGGTVYPGFTLIAGNTVNGINETALFQTPFMIDYFNPNKMYYGANDVWRSNNIKAPNADDVVFEEVSHNLAGINPDTRIEFIEQSRGNGSILYVAYENGRMFRSDNIGSSDPTWTELPIPNNSGGVRFESHPTDANIVYMVRGHSVYKSINKGASWIDISGDLPDLGMMSIAYMNGSQDGLYVGTTAGVYYKDNTMNNWVLFKADMPLTQVRDLVINYSTTPAQIFAATFGRGVWKTQVMTSYKPDLIAGAGTVTSSGSVINATNDVTASASMVIVENVTVKYYLSVNQNITTSDYLVSTVEIPEITSGSTVQCQINNLDVAGISPEIPEGSYYLGLIIDPENAIVETDETNNVWQSTSLVTIPEIRFLPSMCRRLMAYTVRK
ncbi:MAG: hypothetical protein IPH45_15210 [Bacteroidales bacterium]|nr:hypothetical protein [Bacteroidales bacterium]